MPEEIEVDDHGTAITLDTGHVIKVQDTLEEVMNLITGEEEWLYFHPWGRIDDYDYVTVPSVRIAFARSLREIAASNA